MEDGDFVLRAQTNLECEGKTNSEQEEYIYIAEMRVSTNRVVRSLLGEDISPIFL